METLIELGNVLPYADWSLETFLESATTNLETLGAIFLGLMGLIGLVWGGTLLIKKLMSGQQDQTSWGKIIMLIIIGGALMAGSGAIIFEIGSSGEQTIRDLGE